MDMYLQYGGDEAVSSNRSGRDDRRADSALRCSRPTDGHHEAEAGALGPSSTPAYVDPPESPKHDGAVGTSYARSGPSWLAYDASARG